MTYEAQAASVLNTLAVHVGCDNGLKVGALAAKCGLSERDVRSAVTNLRLNGCGICAHPATGYFLAANDEELEKYCLAFLRKRAIHSFKLISSLTHTALPDLMGQLNLKT